MTKREKLSALRMFDPSLGVDWRWQDARRTVDEGRKATRKRDPDWLVEVVAYLRAMQRCKDDRGRARVAARYSEIDQARRFAEAGGQALWEVQARLLAGQSDDEIATLCGLSPGAVNRFESLFYAVRERIEAHDWVLTRAIRPGMRYLSTPPDLATTWRQFGYYAGPLVLDVVIAVSMDRPLPVWTKDMKGADQPGFEEQLRLKCRLAIGAHMLPTDVDPMALFRLQTALMRERQLKRQRAPVSTIERQSAEVLAAYEVCRSSGASALGQAEGA
jgi:hypothetical protein